MEKIDIKFAHLHNPLFFAGRTWGDKLNLSAVAGLRMQYDRTEKELIVGFDNQECIVPVTNIQSMQEGIPDKRPQQIHHPMVQGIASAQVETPYGHVHAGPGHGKTGKSK